MTMLRARTVLACAAAALVAATLTACGGDSGDSPAVEDQGTVPPAVLPSFTAPSGQPTPDDPLEEKLESGSQVQEGWVSAPWGLAAPVTSDTTELKIVYVAGETVCYGPGGFTVKEESGKVTVGAYLEKVAEPAGECLVGQWAYKWGTITLSEPLGSRELYHAGVDQMFDGFVWDPWEGTETTVETPEPEETKYETPADEAPADETPADETTTDETPADETTADEAPADEASTPADEEGAAE
ncbi:MAG: hypothetical protein LBR27_10935 [Bifidobacteriaceae bacterium]|jgi:hypothetical protein|nr:hypothetical protein [Bifidobacteriaceae bacterium]